MLLLQLAQPKLFLAVLLYMIPRLTDVRVALNLEGILAAYVTSRASLLKNLL